jgi:hypothetical protein
MTVPAQAGRGGASPPIPQLARSRRIDRRAHAGEVARSRRLDVLQDGVVPPGHPVRVVRPHLVLPRVAAGRTRIVLGGQALGGQPDLSGPRRAGSSGHLSSSPGSVARRDRDRRPVYRWLPGLQPAPAWRGWFLLIRFPAPARAPGLPDTLPGRMQITGCARPGGVRLGWRCPGVDAGHLPSCAACARRWRWPRRSCHAGSGRCGSWPDLLLRRPGGIVSVLTNLSGS